VVFLFQFWLSIVIFILAYILIIHGRVHRAIVAMAGAVMVVGSGILTQEQGVGFIDFNTIGLLVGMMIMVGITRKSGVFEFLAIKSAKLVGGSPLAILAILSLMTAVLSALLDNVTTVLLIIPVTYAITDRLDISPVPFLFAEIIAGNIGGTATLIGDPPNIMIASATGLGFMDFIANLALPSALILFMTTAIMVLWFRKDLRVEDTMVESVLVMNEHDAIDDMALLKKSLVVLAATIIGFLLHQTLHLETATIALLGAIALLLFTSEDIEEAFLTIEWPTIFFFIGLFIMVGGLQGSGVIQFIAEKALHLTGSNVTLTGMLVLWLSALSSAFVDNIPFVATMIPLLKTVGHLGHIPMESIWWALSLGACLGGNGTLIGASANVVVAGIAEKYGTPIKFSEFLKLGFPLMLFSIAVASIYLYLAYWR
jgi:Na+/H+ antiporter NhaD/arsenite permease-like protein